MDRGAWWAAVHGVATSGMTEWLHFHFSLSCIGEGNGNPLQRSCPENPRDGGAWWAAVYGVAQSRTQLKRLSSSSSSRELLNIIVSHFCFSGFSVSPHKACYVCHLWNVWHSVNCWPMDSSACLKGRNPGLNLIRIFVSELNPSGQYIRGYFHNMSNLASYATP